MSIENKSNAVVFVEKTYLMNSMRRSVAAWTRGLMIKILTINFTNDQTISKKIQG
jgi:hypothetical protein